MNNPASENRAAAPTGLEPAGTGARVLKEIIRTPAFRELIKINLEGMDPASAAGIVRTLLWEDPNLSLSLAAASPRAVNYMVEAMVELGRELGRFPPDMMDAFLSELLEGINADGLRRIPDAWGPVLERVLLINPRMREKVLDGFYEALNRMIRAGAAVLKNLYDGPQPRTPGPRQSIDTAALAEAITYSARLINRSISENPRFMRDIFSRVDLKELLKVMVRSFMVFVVSVAGRIRRWASRALDGLRGRTRR